MPAPQRPAPTPPAAPAAPAAPARAVAPPPRPPGAPATGQIQRSAAAPARPVTKSITRPVTKSIARPVTKSIARSNEPRSLPSFTEDAEDLQNASAVIPPAPLHGSAAGRSPVTPHSDGRVQGLAILAGILGLGLAVVVVLWVMAWSDANRTASRLARATDEASAKGGEMERSNYEAHLARVRNGCLVLAYAVDQLDASRVAGTLKGGGMGMLKEAAEALGAVAHAQTGLTAKILADLKVAHGKMKDQKVPPVQDKALSAVISAGAAVAALQEKALAGLEENQVEAFTTEIGKVRVEFTKAYRELAEIARF